MQPFLTRLNNIPQWITSTRCWIVTWAARNNSESILTSTYYQAPWVLWLHKQLTKISLYFSLYFRLFLLDLIHFWNLQSKRNLSILSESVLVAFKCPVPVHKNRRQDWRIWLTAPVMLSWNSLEAYLKISLSSLPWRLL